MSAAAARTPHMTPAEFQDARIRLGHMWGYGRRLTFVQMAAALGLNGRDPGQTALMYERGRTEVSGPMARLIDAMLNHGYRPPEMEKT